MNEPVTIPAEAVKLAAQAIAETFNEFAGALATGEDAGSVADDWMQEARAALTAGLPTILAAERGPAECVMTHTPPMDFAQCETHDETFPLGGTCRFNGRETWEVYAEEADEQRRRAVRAEHELEAERERIAAAAELMADELGWDGFTGELHEVRDYTKDLLHRLAAIARGESDA